MAKLIVFYDGSCRFCRYTMASLKKHDTRGRLKGLNFRDSQVMEHYHLQHQNVENRIYVLRTRTNQGFSGIRAVLEIVKQVPFYWIWVPFIQFSILLGVGDACYDFIARRRRLIPVGRCQDNSCDVPRNHP
ncbi:DUF393 domain-containing protein [Sporolactobacillus sp. THM7-7]|nr:DUF393 domain-containing protein [Sporolactobacillus sp. THM7-7]